MKQILFAAVAALAITGCSQNEDIERAADKAEINFNTAVSKTTKAVTTTNANFDNFKVYAYSHAAAFDASTTGVGTVIDGVDFDRTGTSPDYVWSADGGKKFYWPATDKVSFFAYSPKTTTNATVASFAQATGAPKFTYTVATTPATQEDLVVAQKVDQTTGTVALNFKHALTKVAFKVKGSGDGITYTVTKIAVSAKDKGEYTYGVTDGVLGTWDATTGTATEYTVLGTGDTALSFEGSDTTPTPEANIKSLVTDANTLMLIPQSGVTVKVTYESKYTGGSVIHTSAEETITISDTWLAGNNFVYTLALKPGSEIAITGSLEDTWTSTDKDAPMN